MSFDITYKDFNSYYKDAIIYQLPQEIGVIVDELKEIKADDRLKGDLVEVGVFQGAMAHIMNEVLPGRSLYLFDTFSGFPDALDESDPKHYEPGHCATDESQVTRLLGGKKEVTIVKGIFPETGGIIKDKKFAFAHIDVDIYSSTKDALEFLYPRMEPGGTIIVHDYPAHTGVKKAADEFLAFLDEKPKSEVFGIRQLKIKKPWTK